MQKIEEKVKQNVAAEFRFLAHDWSNFITDYETFQTDFGDLRQTVLQLENDSSLNMIHFLTTEQATNKQFESLQQKINTISHNGSNGGNDNSQQSPITTPDIENLQQDLNSLRTETAKFEKSILDFKSNQSQNDLKEKNYTFLDSVRHLLSQI